VTYGQYFASFGVISVLMLNSEVMVISSILVSDVAIELAFDGHQDGVVMKNDTRSSRPTHDWPLRVRVAMSALALCACSADTIVDVPADGRSHTIAAAVGQQVDITLQNVGPAIYATPPLISSRAVSYLSVDDVPPNNPAGPTQRFRFKATSTGEAIVTFRRMLGDSLVSVVEDTVRVH
jgi:hypothetical protein